MMPKIAVALEHEKGFLLADGPSDVDVICIFRNSILLPANNDIVQRDIETGELQRTFRAHTKEARAFVVTPDDRMISYGEDNMIIVWDLISGSVKKKIWLGATPTGIAKIIFRDNQLFTGGYDTRIRQIDLTSGKTVQTIGSTYYLRVKTFRCC
jgi:WD40 repeat protein